MGELGWLGWGKTLLKVNNRNGQQRGEGGGRCGTRDVMAGRKLNSVGEKDLSWRGCRGGSRVAVNKNGSDGGGCGGQVSPLSLTSIASAWQCCVARFLGNNRLGGAGTYGGGREGTGGTFGRCLEGVLRGVGCWVRGYYKVRICL